MGAQCGCEKRDSLSTMAKIRVSTAKLHPDGEGMENRGGGTNSVLDIPVGQRIPAGTVHKG